MSMYEEQGEHDRQGDVAGVQPGGVAPDRPGLASQLCPPGYIWLGDLAGWEVAGTVAGAGQVSLHHRCGWNETLRASGICADFSVYVGNVVERVLELLETHVCTPREPSQEHKDRVQRWVDSASGGARPVVDRDGGPQAGLLSTGPMVNSVSSVEAARTIAHNARRRRLGDEAAEQPAARQRCCPTCYTPADDDGVQREHHIQCAQKEPANIPVRRRIDGKWQTIEITLSEWRAVEGADGREPFRVVEGEIRTGDAGGDD